MKTLAAFSVLLLVAACQTAPPEVTEAERAQIEAEVLQAAEDWFDGFRQHDLDLLMAAYHPTETSFGGGRAPRDYATIRESWANQFENVVKYELDWTETVVKVLSRDAAVFQGYYDATGTYADGRIFHWPGNVSFTVLMERTPDGWKITMGAGTNGTAQRIDQIYGTYDWTTLSGQALPSDSISSGWLDWRPDGSWTSYEIPAGASEPVEYEGQSSIGGRTEECFPFQAWQNEAPDEPFSGTVCDGVITADDGSFVGQKRG